MLDLSALPKFSKFRFQIVQLIPDWEKSYPHIDVLSQVQWAHNWILENPKKDKKNYVRYLGNWMRNAERRALERKTNVTAYSAYKEDRPPESELPAEEDFRKMKEALKKRRLNEI